MNREPSTAPPASAEHDFGYYVMIAGLAGLACLLVRQHGSAWVVAASVALATALMGFAWLVFLRGKDSSRAGATIAFMGVVLAGLVAVFPPRSDDLASARANDQPGPTPQFPAATEAEAASHPASEPGEKEADPAQGGETRSRGVAVIFENTFAVSSVEIEGKMLADLQSIAGSLNRYPQYEILLVGHTDPLESPDGSLALSYRRAEAVADHLARLGVDRRRIRVDGRGSTEPIADVTTAEGRRTNRRVELAIFR